MIFKNKILLRFFFILSLLLIFPFPLNISDKFELPTELVNSVYHELIPWIGKHILHLEKDITQFSGGSGDTTYDYVLLLFFVVLSIVGALIWTILSKKDSNSEKLNHILEIALRYFVGYTMLYYGLAKVIPLQFPEPSFYRLLHTYGESSPMGILWTFMGASKGYVIFSGLGETIGGMLLFHRKTKLLGGLILIPVLINVVALNFFYDVPVKLFSLQLLVFAILIILPDLNRLTKAIFSNSAINAKKVTTYFDTGKYGKIKPILKWITVLALVFSPIATVLKYNKIIGPNVPKAPLYGLYEVTNFIKNNDTIQPMLNDTLSWRYIGIEREKTIDVYRNNMYEVEFESEIDTIAREILMTAYADSTNTFKLKYVKNDSTMNLSGTIHQDTISITTKRLSKKDFLLLGRGFHWINETPFNR